VHLYKAAIQKTIQPASRHIVHNISEKQNRSSASQEVLISWNRMVYYCVCKSTCLVPILKWSNSEMCAILGYYTASCGNCLPTFQENIGPVFKGQESRTLETLVNNYHTTPRNVPEECRSHQHLGRSLKSRLE
jgi:hypothetical protein